MFGISKKTLLQLVREFWIPFLAASGWTIYSVWGQDVTVKSVLANFGPSFFLASWMTGQFFRVRKQAGVETSLGKVESRLNHLIDELEAKTQHMIGYITGGSSYLYFMPLQVQGNKIMWIACHSGEYPLHQVTVRVVDLERLRNGNRRKRSLDFESTHKLGDVHRGTNLPLCENDIDGRDELSFNIFTHARNGKITQETQFVRVEGKLLTALRITGSMGIMREEVDPNFPRNEQGKIAWVNKVSVDNNDKSTEETFNAPSENSNKSQHA